MHSQLTALGRSRRSRTQPGSLLLGARPFSSYVGQILQAEGLNGFTSVDIASLSPSLLSSFSVVVLGETPLTPTDVSTLTSWVNGGGRLIAIHPDKQLAGLLGLTDAGTTLSNGYLLEHPERPGAGRRRQTIQFHGAADRYNLTGATSVATLYSSPTAATSNPAVTTRNVGSNGGQAAAFTYDLARSVVYTRQGNPAWAGQDRDGAVGTAGIMSTDLFYGAKPGDVQPDWVNLDKVSIPQADEQQRLLANFVVLMSRDRTPAPRFWYLPRGEKAAVVMTGDDHGHGETAARFDLYKDQSPAGCSVANWDCVRATSYMYPDTTLTNAQAAGYTADGFEVALHPNDGTGCGDPDPETLDVDYTVQLGEFAQKYTSVPAPKTLALPLHLVARLCLAREGRARARHPLRHELLLLPAGVDPESPRLVDRFRVPDALRRRERKLDRRLPGGKPARRRDTGGRTTPRADLSCSTAPSARRGSTASSRPTCTPTSDRATAPTTSSPRRRLTACRS